MNTAGIDYGNGLVNIDHKTGIRYGVISQNSVLQAWCDSSEPVYPNTCPYCGNEPINNRPIYNYKKCPTCKHTIDPDQDFDYQEPSTFVVNEKGLKAESCMDNDIIVLKSDYYTLCRYCSPCVPGAGDIDSQDSKGIKAYCFGPDWYDENSPEIAVYQVKDNLRVK